MKKVNLFSMVTALLLAATSCSDDIDNGGNKPGEPIDGNGVYLTVNVVTPSAGGAYTKAPTGGETGDGHLTALDNENKVNGVTIVLYGNNNSGTQEDGVVEGYDINTDGMIVIASSYAEATDADANDKYEHHTGKKATVFLNSEFLKKNIKYRILAIANANVTEQFPAGASLKDCKIGKYASHKTSDNNFIMSTHVEKNKDNDGTIVHSIVSFDGSETTETDAATGTVWVERLSARIDYTGTTYAFEVHQDGENTKPLLANVTLEGVAPVNVAKHDMYIFKQLTEATAEGNIDGTLNALIDEVYDPANTKFNYVIEPTTIGRTETGNTAKTFDNQYSGGSVGNLTFKSFTDGTWTTYSSSTLTPITGPTSQPTFRIITYAGENTMASDNQTHFNTTGVIFKAKYDPEKLWVYNGADGTLSEADKPFTTGFYRVNNKLYKELEAAEAELIVSGNDLSGTSPLVWLRKNFTKDTWDLGTISFDNFKSVITAAATGQKDLGYLKFLSDKLNESGVTNVDGATMKWSEFMETKAINANTDSDNQKITVNEGDFPIEYYGTAHTCYYPYWIRHANNGNDETMGIMEFCIVRNNVYRLNVTDIQGLGMADPFDSTDKPDEGEELGVYLKVELYVHDWVVRDNEGIIFK